MPLHKTAIAVPEHLLADVDRAASERGESRSAYVTRVLAVAVRTRRDAEITRKLDELFADARSKKAQRRSAAGWKPSEPTRSKCNGPGSSDGTTVVGASAGVGAHAEERARTAITVRWLARMRIGRNRCPRTSQRVEVGLRLVG
jgi:hypothetical protein